MKRIASVWALLAAIFFLVACTPKEYKFEVRMKEFKFEPDSLSVPAGTNVTLELKNEGTLEHEIVIMLLGKNVTLPFDEDDEANIYWEAELPKGESQVVSFVAPAEPGVYELVCGTAGHLEQGMKGTLEVTE